MTSETFNLKSRIDQMMSELSEEEQERFWNFVGSFVDSLELPKIVNAAAPILVSENDSLKARIAATESIIRRFLMPAGAPSRFLPTQAIGAALLRVLNPDAEEYP